MADISGLNGRLKSLERFWGADGQTPAIPWPEWVRDDAITRRVLSAWPDALAAYSSVVTSVDRDHQVREDEWIPFLSAVRASIEPFGPELCIVLADALEAERTTS